MRIVSRSEFLAMPYGTLYSKYEPCNFGPLQIKGSTLPTNDFFTQGIHDAVNVDSTDEFFDKLEAAREDGTSLQMDFYVEGRDGMFDDEQLFAVWEHGDVVALVVRLQNAMKDYMRNA